MFQLSVAGCCLTTSDELHPLLQASLAAGGVHPGVQLRVYKSALDEMSRLMADTAFELVPRMKLPDYSSPIQKNEREVGVVHMRDINVLDFDGGKRPWLLMEPANKLSWHMQDAMIKVLGELSGNYGRWELSGDATTTVTGIRVAALIRLSNSGRRLRAHLVKCSVNADDVQVTVSDGGLVGSAINIFRGITSRTTRPLVLRELCHNARRLVNGNVNRQLRTYFDQLNVADMLRHTGSRALKQDTFGLNKLKQMLKTDKLEVDYDMVGQPRVTMTYVETGHVGETTVNGSPPTPFGPPPLPRYMVGGRDMSVLVTDYVLNSVLWQLYHNGLLQLTIDENTEQIGQYLQIECSDGFAICVTDVLWDFTDNYPSHTIAAQVNATRPPVVLISAKPDSIRLEYMAQVEFLAVDGWGRAQTFLAVDVASIVLIKLSLNKHKLSANVEIDKFDLRVASSRLDSFEAGDDLADLAELARLVVQDTINYSNVLTNGVKLPDVNGFRLKNPRLSIRPRGLLLASDLQYDEQLIKKIVEDVLLDYA